MRSLTTLGAIRSFDLSTSGDLPPVAGQGPAIVGPPDPTPIPFPYESLGLYGKFVWGSQGASGSVSGITLDSGI